jgi:transposase-like protein
VVNVRDGAHIAVGVDMDGIKHVLGIRVQTAEGAKFWAGVCAELANRGVADVLIVCCDGLTGFPEATWPRATVQTCVAHLICTAMRFVSHNQRRKVAAALKPISRRLDLGDGGEQPRRVRAGGHRALRDWFAPLKQAVTIRVGRTRNP